MRIGIVSEYVRPWPGGISEHVHHEAQGLRQRGHLVKVYSGPGPGPEAEVRLPYQVCFGSNGARNRLSLGKQLFSLQRSFEQDQLDVLHVHAPLDPLLPLASVLAAPCPVVGTFHASLTPSLSWDLYHRCLGPYARRALARMTDKIAVSQEAARSLTTYFDTSCQIIPNGVDLERFMGSSKPKRESTASAGEPRTLLFVGRPDPRKGLPVVLDAFERLLLSDANLRLELVGVSEADLPAQYRGHARVVCFGVVAPEAVAARFQAADIVCAPSLRGESQGVVLLEAMAAQKALVCSDIPGYREVVRHGLEGLLVGPGRADELAHAVSRLLQNPGAASALGQAGRSRAARFSWQRVLDALEGVLARACHPTVKSPSYVRAYQASPWN